MGLSSKNEVYETTEAPNDNYALAERAFEDLSSLVSIASGSADVAKTMLINNEWVIPNPWAVSEEGPIWTDQVVDDVKVLLSLVLGFPENGRWFSPALFINDDSFSISESTMSGSVIVNFMNLMSPSEPVSEQSGGGESEEEIDTTWLPLAASCQPSISQVAQNVAAAQSLAQTKNYSLAVPGIGRRSSNASLSEEVIDD